MHQDYCAYVATYAWLFNRNMIEKIGYILHNDAFMSVKFHTGIMNGNIKPSSSKVSKLNHSKHPKSHLSALH